MKLWFGNTINIILFSRFEQGVSRRRIKNKKEEKETKIKNQGTRIIKINQEESRNIQK